jgi:hypothetical protein
MKSNQIQSWHHEESRLTGSRQRLATMGLSREQLVAATEVEQSAQNRRFDGIMRGSQGRLTVTSLK